VTCAEQGILQQAVEKELLAVFIPTTPNPTSGFLVYLAPADVTLLDMNVEEAMKLVISGGAYLPSRHRGETVADAADGPESPQAGESP